jgi:hypothetical protein
MIVVCARESPRSAIISARSRKLSLYRRYQRTQSTIISWSKCRPLKSPSIFVCARQLCRSTDLPTTMLCPSSSHQSLLQHVDDLAPLEVNDNSPVSATLSPAPIVDACHPYKRPRAETGDLPFQMPQNGVVADWHAETFHQPFSRPAASAVAEKMNKFSDSLGPPSVRTNNFRQLIRKCLTLALPVQTSPTAHLHLHHHGGALHGEILKMTEVSAVPTCRRRAASGTGAYFRSHRRDHPTIAVSLDLKNPHVRSGSPIHVLSHARLSARCPIKPTSTESEADPV